MTYDSGAVHNIGPRPDELVDDDNPDGHSESAGSVEYRLTEQGWRTFFRDGE
jgi:hypothetical protein